MHSTAIAVLVGALKKAREHGGNLALICAIGHPMRVFTITGLTKILSIYSTRDELLAESSPA